MKKSVPIFCLIVIVNVTTQAKNGYTIQRSRDPFYLSVIQHKNQKKHSPVTLNGIVKVGDRQGVILTIHHETETLFEGQAFNGYLVKAIQADGVVLAKGNQCKKYFLD